jgi:hypothetical protein
MKPLAISVLLLALILIGGNLYAPGTALGNTSLPKNDPVAIAVEKGVRWLASVQGKDGGWGQDGGETSYVRQGEHLESSGNDVANTAVAAAALMRTGSTPVKGEYHLAIQRALDFVLTHVESSSTEGLAITDLRGTQIERKLGPYIDTFLTSKLLAELDGNMGDGRANARVRAALQKCVAKIEKNQMRDGSWNLAGGWAPILGTSMASQSLFMARQKGVQVSEMAMARVDDYTKNSAQPQSIRVGGRVDGAAGRGAAGGVIGGIPGGAPSAITGGVSTGSLMAPASPAAAGVPLYQGAQALEQLSRTDADRVKNKDQIVAITSNLAKPSFVTGFGSYGGEEFFSYLNVSDSLYRTGGPEWAKWNGDIKTRLIKLQNEDGTWAGHHCITGRVAVTSAAILTLLVDRDPVPVPTSSRKN